MSLGCAESTSCGTVTYQGGSRPKQEINVAVAPKFKSRLRLKSRKKPGENSFRTQKTKRSCLSYWPMRFLLLTIPGVELISTKDKDAVSSTRDDMDVRSPCSHEETDTRILLHVADAANQGITRVLVRSRDTDVLVLCVGNFGNIPGLEELWVSSGTSSHQKYLAVHELTKVLGKTSADAQDAFLRATGFTELLLS